jgi:hypothetical protein
MKPCHRNNRNSTNVAIMKILHCNTALAVTFLRDHMLVSMSLFGRNLNVCAKSEKFRSLEDKRDTIGFELCILKVKGLII